MKIYIDFDGVILDTDKTIDENIKGTSINRKEYIQNANWEDILKKSSPINNSLYYLKNSTKDIALLSKVGSLGEGINKVKFLRENNITMNIHLVPNTLSKSDIVNPKGNILIDDKIYNLDKWVSLGGIGYFYNGNNDDTDIYGNINTKYKKITSLEMLIK